MRLVKEKLPMLNAMTTPRNAMNVKRVTMVATLLPSVPPPVESHMPSATQELESAHHVTQQRTKSALKFRTLATKNASHKYCQNATLILESARNALKVPAVSQPLVVKQHANTFPTQTMIHTYATGLNHHQNVNKIRLDQ